MIVDLAVDLEVDLIVNVMVYLMVGLTVLEIFVLLSINNLEFKMAITK